MFKQACIVGYKVCSENPTITSMPHGEDNDDGCGDDGNRSLNA